MRKEQRFSTLLSKARFFFLYLFELCIQKYNSLCFCSVKMQMLIARSEKEKAGLLVLKEEMMKKEREQSQNMQQAGLIEAQQQRETYIQENQALSERLLELQNENEEQMKVMKSISEMIVVHQSEKEQLLDQMKTLSPEELTKSLKRLERRQSEEVNALLMKMEALVGGIKSSGGEDFNATTKDDECAKKMEDLPDIMTSRAQIARGLHQRIAENERDQRDLKTGEILKKVLKFMGDVARIYSTSCDGKYVLSCCNDRSMS